VTNELRIGATAIEAFIAALASDAVSPGCGAAGAVALALAAACARKAILITAKHRALSQPLRVALPALAQLQETALHEADEDSDGFRKLIRHPDASATEDVRETDSRLLDDCQSLSDIVDSVSGEIHDVAEGDIRAARALLAAAFAIHQFNKATLDRASPR
jgi:formiminotetrahydrofolate cyclodeaminase